MTVAEVEGDRHVAYFEAVAYVVTARTPLAAGICAACDGDASPLSVDLRLFAREWWRWKPPELRVMVPEHAWDTLESVWKAPEHASTDALKQWYSDPERLAGDPQ